ncbi:bidirectional sugar transporter SWEET12 [Forsythia ovata]|uniref:Bidirectional sugar transporter SWEET12 n=1 Tax=Forsythia ovata TaxID=205694 RepID=A0ABD1P092_9LAMI
MEDTSLTQSSILKHATFVHILTLKLLLLLDFGGFGSILILTHFLTNGSKRVEVLGWICVSLATSVYIAPLSIMTNGDMCINAETGDSHQKCRVYAVLIIILPHFECYNVVLLRFAAKGLVYRDS